MQIELFGLRLLGRPGGELPPLIAACLVDISLRQTVLTFALEKMIEELQFDVLLVEGRRIAGEGNVADLGLAARPAAMRPGADDHDVEDAGILLFERPRGLESAIQVVSIEDAAGCHDLRGDA